MKQRLQAPRPGSGSRRASGFLFGMLGTVLLAGAATAAGPVHWDWPAGRPFKGLQLEGAALDADGFLTSGLAAEKVGPQGAEVFWRLAADGHGGWFTGTGHDGEILHTDAAGESRSFARVDGAEVFSLLPLPDGGLLVGCGPEGQIYRIDDQGQESLLGKAEGGYVWSILADNRSDRFWLATGSPAALYRWDQKEGLERIRAFPAQNVLDVAFAADGNLLLATQGPGLVYSLDPADPDGAHLLFETPQDEARQFLTGPNGDLFLFSLNSETEPELVVSSSGGTEPGPVVPSGPLLMLLAAQAEPTTPRAALWRVDPLAGVLPAWSGDLDLMIASWSPRHGWLAGGPMDRESSRSTLHRLTPPAGHYPVAGWDGGDILDLLPWPTEDDAEAILAAVAHPGGVVRLDASGEGTRRAVSAALDGRRPVRWGRLRWSAEAGAGRLRWSVRGGNRAEPDGSWTEWTTAWSDEDHALDLPPTRFLQWRVEFPAEDGGAAWRIGSVSVSAWLDNLPPVIERFTLEQLTAVQAGGLMAHADNVTQKFRSGLKVEFDRSSEAETRADVRRAAHSRPVRVFTWDADDPDGDRLVYQLEYRAGADREWRPLGDEIAESLLGWNTSEVPDGAYEVRLTASDRLDNPGSLARRSVREMGRVVVDNTPPEISGFGVERIPEGVRIVCRVQDGTSVLAAARVQLPDGTVERLDPADGICDSRREEFAADVPWPRPGVPAADVWRIRIEVQDLAGNLAAAEGEAR